MCEGLYAHAHPDSHALPPYGNHSSLDGHSTSESRMRRGNKAGEADHGGNIDPSAALLLALVNAESGQFCILRQCRL